ncbi:MFS transporter [Streptomyces iconiensis]|uniref:MFS transporter n=1 Tax=Streptomyces iconiensis TaxID=1384038 RepID=A0ABT7A861_9ACTN|nr:MFS transporter [Streptomyces iconiensis]MDJ1137496.1 MFS transporter [Streptomyces iconiensis]
MPAAIYILALGIFSMVTSEFLVAGLMPQISEGLDVTIPQVGYLITAFAAAMAFGGPFLTTALLRMPPKRALMLLFAVFLVGNVMAATAPVYAVLLAARLIGGTAAAAFLGTAISLSMRMVAPEQRGRAVSVALNGLMLGTLLGLPLSTFIGERLGWRAAFWTVSAVTVVAALVTLVRVPRMEPAPPAKAGGGIRAELGVFRSPRLWLVLSTSTLIIGATFSAFSYFNPILTEITGFATGSVPLLLVAYGAATLVGNVVVGRLADRYTLPVLMTGLAFNGLFLAGFALWAELPVPTLLFMLGIGLVGVTMNPAMAARVQKAANTGPLVNTVHSSFITLGIIIGSALGGAAIPHFGLLAPVWIGVAMAVLGIGTLVPDVLRGRKAAGSGPVSPSPVADLPDADRELATVPARS